MPQCWCGLNPDLTSNGEQAPDSECGMACEGTTTGETCGDFLRMSAYEITSGMSSPATYVGCFADMSGARAMPGAGIYSSSEMTNEVGRTRGVWNEILIAIETPIQPARLN